MKKLNVKIIVPIILVAIVVIGIILVIPKEEKNTTSKEELVLNMIQAEFEKGYKVSEKDFKEIIDIKYETTEITEDVANVYGMAQIKNLYGNKIYSQCSGKFKINRDNNGNISSITTTYLKCGASIMIDVENNINRIK